MLRGAGERAQRKEIEEQQGRRPQEAPAPAHRRPCPERPGGRRKCLICRHRLQPRKELIQISRKQPLCDQMLNRRGPWATGASQRTGLSCPSVCETESRFFLEIHRPSVSRLQLLFLEIFREASKTIREKGSFKSPNATDASASCLPSVSICELSLCSWLRRLSFLRRREAGPGEGGERVCWWPPRSNAWARREQRC